MTSSIFYLSILSINAALAVAVMRHLQSRPADAAPAPPSPERAHTNLSTRNPSAASTLITIELLNPLQLAELRQGFMARVAGIVAPKPIRRIVHDTVANQIREQLASEGAHADVRVVTVDAPKPELAETAERSMSPERVQKTAADTPRPERRERAARARAETHRSRSNCSTSRRRAKQRNRAGSSRNDVTFSAGETLDQSEVVRRKHATADLTPATETNAPANA